MRAITGVDTTDIITCEVDRKWDAGDEIVFKHLVGGSGITEGAIYYVLDPSGPTFQIEATLGGGAVDLLSDITAGFCYSPRPYWARSPLAGE
jgi:hypothetical protein